MTDGLRETRAEPFKVNDAATFDNARSDETFQLDDEDSLNDDGERIEFCATYHNMLTMTLELVKDIMTIRDGDLVITMYGEGKCLSRKRGGATNGNSSTSMKIALSFGILCVQETECVHKLLTTEKYQLAMDHLEEVRKLQLASRCEQSRVPVLYDACASCLFQKPRTTEVPPAEPSNNTSGGRSWWQRNNKSNTHLKIPSKQICRRVTQKCDVCGNPVCNHHKIDQDFFCMCVECSHDLRQVQSQLNVDHPELHQNLDRLLHCYTRMSIQLTFLIPSLTEVSLQLNQKERQHGRIAIGNSSLGFMGAALSLAGAAAMLTPVGPVILLAGIATSATSGTLQVTHQGYKQFISCKQANQMADRVIAWHGLCLGILGCLEQLRQELLQERANQRSLKASYRTKKSFNNLHSKDNLWNTLAEGGFSTTRHTVTGVGAYTQVMNASLQMTPVVGAALSVGFMAMDAANITSTLKQLQQPNAKSLAVKSVQESFPIHIPTFIDDEIGMLLGAVDDIRAKQNEATRIEELQQAAKEQEEEFEMIEKELEMIK
jgi:hypothetical protein